MKFLGSIIHEENPKSEKSMIKGFTEHVSESIIELESFQFDKNVFESNVNCFSSTKRLNLNK